MKAAVWALTTSRNGRSPLRKRLTCGLVGCAKNLTACRHDLIARVWLAGLRALNSQMMQVERGLVPVSVNWGLLAVWDRQQGMVIGKLD